MLINSVLGSIISQLRSKHYSYLRNTDMDSETRNKALKDYSKKDKAIKDLLRKNYRYKTNTPIYDKIKADVSQIWK